MVNIHFCLFLPHSNLMASKCPPSMMTPLSLRFCLSIHKLSLNSFFKHNKVFWVCGFLGEHGIYILHFIFETSPKHFISFLTWFAGDLEVHKLYAFSLETHKPNYKLATLLWSFLPVFAQFDKTTFINHFHPFQPFCSFCEIWQINISN